MPGENNPGKPHNKPDRNRRHGPNAGQASRNNPQKPHGNNRGGTSQGPKGNKPQDRGQRGPNKPHPRDRGPRRDDASRTDGKAPHRRDDKRPFDKGNRRPQDSGRNSPAGRDNRGGRPDDRGPRSDNRGPRQDGRGQRFDNQRQRPQDRGPRSDNRGQRSDDRRQDGPPKKQGGRPQNRPGDGRGPNPRPKQGDERPQRAPREKEHEPELPAAATADELHGDVRRELRSMPKNLADTVAAHLVAAGQLMEAEPEKALEHARYARKRAARVAAVREANGLAAYHNGQWSEALSELRAARRMSADPGNLPVMADCERALGRPQRALDLSRDPEAPQLERAEAVELTIVAAGARRDLGQIDASVVALQLPELESQDENPWNARLFYAYADNLLAAGRVQDAFTWFVHAADADDDGQTDAADRIDELFVQLGGDNGIDELLSDTGNAERDEAAEPDDHALEGGEAESNRDGAADHFVDESEDQ